jgi:pyruvate/2-oxoacid:ferredoxin oxidoreductase alpha subunit
MNMMLHGIGGDELPLVVADSLRAIPATVTRS